MSKAKISPVFKFDTESQGWCDVTGRVPAHLPAQDYSCFSYNIWFQGWSKTHDDAYRQQLWLPRQQALLNEAKAADADFLCFQEVTNPASSTLLALTAPPVLTDPASSALVALTALPAMLTDAATSGH